MTMPFIGEIQLFGFDFTPRGWAQCNGQLLPIAQNTALFSLIGTTYGGDGRVSFALPNLNGKVACGVGQGPGLTTRNMGATFGEPSVTLIPSQLPGHTHPLEVFVQNETTKRSPSPSAGNALTIPLQAEAFASNASADALFADASIDMQGGNQAHENRQPYLAMNFCIAVVGAYPQFQ